jgi:hypothetical protein
VTFPRRVLMYRIVAIVAAVAAFVLSVADTVGGGH